VDFDRRKAFVNFKGVNDNVVSVIIAEVGEDTKVHRRETRRDIDEEVVDYTRNGSI